MTELSLHDNFTIMKIRTQITEMARKRGLTAGEVARQLGLYPSNLSAMDAGRRSVSLQMLGRVAEVLDCSPGDLLAFSWGPPTIPFYGHKLTRRLQERDLGTPDGVERGWVHKALLAWHRHYRLSRSVQ